MSPTTDDESNASLSLSPLLLDQVLNIEIQLIELDEEGTGFAGLLFYSNTKMNKDSSPDKQFGDLKVSVQGKIIDSYTKIVVKAENVRFEEFSSGDENCHGRPDFDPDQTIHQEKMITIPIAIDSNKGMTEQDGMDETSPPSHLESCSTNSCGSSDTMGNTSQILLPVICQDLFILDSKDLNKPSSPSKENPSNYSMGSTTTRGGGGSTHSNAAENLAKLDENKPPTCVFLCRSFSDESSSKSESLKHNTSEGI